MTIATTTKISQWQRATKHVEDAVRTGQYINAETALLFVGPPRLTDIGGIDSNVTPVSDARGQVGGDTFGASGAGDALYPVGMCEQFSMQQFQNVQKFYEIGSRRSYQAGGRIQVSGSLGRVMFNGPSLLRVLYTWYPSVIAMANGKFLGADAQPDSVSANAVQGSTAKQIYPSIFFEAGSFAAPLPDNPNTRYSFFINLMSELFSHPFGLGLLLRDNADRNYGAFYCEDCLINTHGFSVNSSSNLITEAANFQCDAAVPMEFSTDNSAFTIAPLSGRA
jgi:hypothetical protein